MKILFCGYRYWAQNVYNSVAHGPDHDWLFVQDKDEMLAALRTHEFDLIFCVGWSWIVPKRIVENYVVFGIHPSDLPKYAGGSPLQHQILDGLTETKCTLFRLRPELDSGETIDKEPMSLEGTMEDVLRELAYTSIKLIRRTVEAYPDITHTPTGKVRTKKRLKPEQSQLLLNFETGDVRTTTGPKPNTFGMLRNVRQLYDFIRCRTDPYPNVYVEDETGRLYFTNVRFEPKEDQAE